MKRALMIFAGLLIVIAAFFLFHRKNPPPDIVQAYEPPNLVFITIDTLRADHVGAYGYSKIKTPNIDGLARDGVLFKNAICQTPLTLVSHSSIFTALQPNVHGVRDNAYIVLSEDRTTLAEILKAKGYRTGAFIASAVLDKKYGLAQGFDWYSTYQPSAVVGFESQRRADEVIREAQAWLQQIGNEKFFLWLHLYDPHFPYDPPEPYGSQYDSKYDGEIAYTDEMLGSFLNQLRAKGLLKNALIVLMGDHGESLGDHREEDHGYYIYDSTLRIPWIISWPEHLPKGKIVDAQVQSVDVVPTLAELMRFPFEQTVQGKSVMPLISGEGSYANQYAYAESLTPQLYYGWSSLKCIRTNDWKYIEAPLPELYDLRNDPNELRNLVAEKPQQLRDLREKLKSYLTSTKEASQAPQIDAERLEQLAALGYVGLQDPSRTMNQESSIDPKTKIDDYLLIHGLIPKAVRLLNQGDFKSSLAQLKKVESRFSNSFVLYWYLGYCYANLFNLDAAEKSYAKSIALNPMFGRAYSELALTLALLNRHQDGIRLLENAPAGAMSAADREQIKGEIYTNQSSFDQAEAAFLAALNADPRQSESRYGLARIYLATDRVEKAMGIMQALADEKYPSEDVYDSLADLYARAGQTQRAETVYQRWLEIFPKSAAVHYRYAQFLQSTGRKDLAETHLRKAIELKPDLLKK